MSSDDRKKVNNFIKIGIGVKRKYKQAKKKIKKCLTKEKVNYRRLVYNTRSMESIWNNILSSYKAWIAFENWSYL